MSERETSTAVTTVDDERIVSSEAEPEPDVHQGDGQQRASLTRGETRWLVGIVAVAAVVRLAWLAYAHVDPPVWVIPSGDSYSYWYYGNEIAHGRGYINYMSGEATAYYPIGFPALLGLLFWLANHVPLVDLNLMLVLGVFQLVLSVATVGLTFVVGRRLAGPRAGLVAAAILALFPNLIYQVTAIQLETTFIFFTMAALAIIVDHDWSSGPPSRNRLLAFGAVLAVSALIRPFSTPLLVGLLLAVLATGVGWRRAVAAVSLPLLVLVGAFIPWTVRNAVQMDGFVPSSTNMGDTLCIDRGDGATGGFRWSTHDGCADIGLPEVERNRASTRKAVEFVVEHPDRELLQVARRAHIMFGSDHDGIIATEGLGSGPILSDGTRRLLNTVGDWYFYVVVAAALAGLPLLMRRAPRPQRHLVVVTMVALLVIPLLLWGNPRFHLPLVPLLGLSAGALAAGVADRLVPGAAGAPSPPSSGGQSPVPR